MASADPRSSYLTIPINDLFPTRALAFKAFALVVFYFEQRIRRQRIGCFMPSTHTPVLLLCKHQKEVPKRYSCFCILVEW